MTAPATEMMRLVWAMGLGSCPPYCMMYVHTYIQYGVRTTVCTTPTALFCLACSSLQTREIGCTGTYFLPAPHLFYSTLRHCDIYFPHTCGSFSLFFPRLRQSAISIPEPRLAHQPPFSSTCRPPVSTLLAVHSSLLHGTAHRVHFALSAIPSPGIPGCFVALAVIRVAVRGPASGCGEICRVVKARGGRFASLRSAVHECQCATQATIPRSQ